MRNFNALTGAHEKTGPIPSRISCTEFRLAVEATKLQMLDAVGAYFTWAQYRVNGFVESRLDLAFCSVCSLDFWDFISCLALPRQQLDHCPMLVQCKNSAFSSPRPFRFLSMWTLGYQFLDVIKVASGAKIQGDHYIRFMGKLIAVKESLGHWNKIVFGNVNIQVSRAMEAMGSPKKRYSYIGFFF